jgi:cytochrome c oxidase subunit 2
MPPIAAAVREGNAPEDLVKRDWLLATGLWVVLNVLGFVLIASWSPLPDQYAREAEVVDDAFRLLTILAVPVFAFVLTALIYSAIRWRARGDTFEDGPPIRTNRRIVGVWLTVTTILALVILIKPGFVGLAALRGKPSADLVIGVSGSRWIWTITYPNGGTTTEELVVPVDTRIRFDVTATDIVHSFWVPAFRTKADAVPGRVHPMFVTVERVGSFSDDPTLRVQCAELCGLGHGQMAIPVRIVERAEFETWMSSLILEASATGEGT